MGQLHATCVQPRRLLGRRRRREGVGEDVQPHGPAGDGQQHVDDASLGGQRVVRNAHTRENTAKQPRVRTPHKITSSERASGLSAKQTG
jgi:hypothetical protein